MGTGQGFYPLGFWEEWGLCSGKGGAGRSGNLALILRVDAEVEVDDMLRAGPTESE